MQNRIDAVTRPRDKERRAGIALMLGIMVMFAGYDATSKFLSPRYPVSELLWVRYLTHVGLILAIFGPRMRLGLFRTARPFLQVLRASMLVAVSFLIMFGLRHISLADTTAIVFLAPLLVTALSSPLLKEKVGRPQWVAVVFGFIGVLVIVRPGGSALNPAMLFPLGSAVCYALYQVLTRKFSGAENPVTSHLFTGMLGLLVCSVTWQSDWIVPSLDHAILMVSLGVYAGVGHFLLIKVYERTPPVIAAPFSYTQLAWAVLFGYLFFGEMPDFFSMLGILIIAASGVYVVMHPNRA